MSMKRFRTAFQSAYFEWMQITIRYDAKNVQELSCFLDSREEWKFRGGSSSEICNWLQKELLEWEYRL